MEDASSMFWALDGRLYALQKMGRAWSFMENSHALAKSKCSEGKNSIYGQHYRPGSPACSWGLKKRQ